MELTVGTVRRCADGETVCGDAFAVIEDGDTVLVTVVDGLGHGPGAAEASEAFIEFVSRHPEQPLSTLMQTASNHLRSTRGAAAALVRLDRAANTIEHCGVGNIHFHSLAEKPINPVPAPGIVGHRIRKITASEFELPEHGLFALCSDGISSRIDLRPLANLSPQEVADALLEHHGKSHDDVTCVVVAY